jgi:hypothetical protein
MPLAALDPDQCISNSASTKNPGHCGVYGSHLFVALLGVFGVRFLSRLGVALVAFPPCKGKCARISSMTDFVRTSIETLILTYATKAVVTCSCPI